MAFDVTRQFLGQALQQKLLQQTPAYQQQLLEGELKNRMLAMEMDEMFPLKMQMLQKEMEYMIDPYTKIEAEQASRFKYAAALEELNAKNELLKIALAGEQDRMTKATPSTTYNYGDPSSYNQKNRTEMRKDLNTIARKLKTMEFSQKVWDDATATEITKRGVFPERKPEYDKTLALYNSIQDELYSVYGDVPADYDPAPVVTPPTQEDVLDEQPEETIEQKQERLRNEAVAAFNKTEKAAWRGAEQEAKTIGDLEFFRQKRLRNKLAF